jgi:hypothetical protein
MTPAENPITIEINFGFGCLIKRENMHPIVVAKPASNANKRPSIKDSIYKTSYNGT